MVTSPGTGGGGGGAVGFGGFPAGGQGGGRRNWYTYRWGTDSGVPGALLGPYDTSFDFIYCSQVYNRCFVLWNPIDAAYYNQFSGAAEELNELWAVGLEFTTKKRSYPAHCDRWWIYWPTPASPAPSFTRLHLFLHSSDQLVAMHTELGG